MSPAKPPEDAKVLRHADAMGRAARRLGESERSLSALWSVWCGANGVDEAAAAVGWLTAMDSFLGADESN